MKRKSFESVQCPIARGLERVGEWWSMLILRDAFAGITRFDDFQKSLDIAPNMLTRRLTALVDDGLLERRRYSERPPRDEYLLTQKGIDFRPVLVALQVWGNRHYCPEGKAVITIDTRTGSEAQPALVDLATGDVMTYPTYRSAAGPAAGEQTRRRYARFSGIDPAHTGCQETH